MKTINTISKLREKRKLREDLLAILETESGQRFFKILLRECHVTKPVFHSDVDKLRECEGRRRLAMSFLSLLGQDDPQYIINKIEEENNV
jgi:hypothetical protein